MANWVKGSNSGEPETQCETAVRWPHFLNPSTFRALNAFILCHPWEEALSLLFYNLWKLSRKGPPVHSRQEIQPSPTGPPHLLHRSPPLSASMLPPTPWSSAEPIVVLWGDGASFPKALKYQACNNKDTASHWKEMAPMETSGDAVFSSSFLGPAQT